jgi:hypothetical protein
MHLRTFIAVAMLLSVGNATGQSKSDATESQLQALQAILTEIRQFRQDLHTSTVASQRAQILIYRVQLQDSVVRRLQDRIDQTRTALTQMRAEDRRIASDLKQQEDFVGQVDNPVSRKQFEDLIARLKADQEAQAKMEEETHAKLTESEDQLNLEQAKLGRLQDELDRLDKTLEEFSHR